MAVKTDHAITLVKPRPEPTKLEVSPNLSDLAEGAVASLNDTGAAGAQGLAKTFILQGAGLTVELVFMFEEKSMCLC